MTEKWHWKKIDEKLYVEIMTWGERNEEEGGEGWKVGGISRIYGDVIHERSLQDEELNPSMETEWFVKGAKRCRFNNSH